MNFNHFLIFEYIFLKKKYSNFTKDFTNFDSYQNHSTSNAFFESILGCIRPFIDVISTKSPNFRKGQKELRDDFEVPFDELKNLRWLGSGAQGCVFKGTFKNEEVAIKKVKSKEEANIRHLKRLNHPNLVKFKGKLIN